MLGKITMVLATLAVVLALSGVSGCISVKVDEHAVNVDGSGKKTDSDKK